MFMIRLFIVFSALVTIAIIIWGMNHPRPAEQTSTTVTEIATDNTPEATPAAIGGPFTLTDQNGNAVSDTNFRGKLMLVFFGFTNCPDICPAAVASINGAMTQLGDKANDVVPIFITVDPERDTPEVLKAYLTPQDARFVGLTGTREEIQKAVDAYKGYAKVTDVPPASEHAEHGDHASVPASSPMVEHSGFLYLMDRDGAYVTHFESSASAEEITAAIQKQLEATPAAVPAETPAAVESSPAPIEVLEPEAAPAPAETAPQTETPSQSEPQQKE